MASNAGIFMSQKESFKYQIINQYLNGSLNRSESATLLRVSERTISRIATKVRELGFFGVKNGNIGRKPKIAIAPEIRELVLELVSTKYFDFNTAHFAEILKKQYGLNISYNTVWRWLKAQNMIKNPRVRRRKKRVYRSRMPQEGLLLQMDGCHHKFNGKDEWCLIAAIDDATSDIPFAEFFKMVRRL